MKPGLRPGASRVNRITIGPERTISFMGDEARTYATPTMIRDIEYTCRAGTHTRFVVDKAKTFERIKAKAARFAARAG